MSKKQEDWGKLLKEYELSGLSQISFCKKHGLLPNQFQYRLKAYKSQAKASLVKVNQQDFEPIELISQPVSCSAMSELSITLPNHIRCDMKLALSKESLSLVFNQLVSLC